LLGDEDQCPPYISKGSRGYDYMTSKFIKYLLDCNRVLLKYKFGSSRYDEELYNEVLYLNNTKQLSTKWKNQGVDGRTDTYNICWTHKKRNEINQHRFNQLCKDKKQVIINNETWAIGMPIITYNNYKSTGLTVYNSDRYTLLDVNEEFVVLKNEEYTKQVPIHLFTRYKHGSSVGEKGLFDYAYCITVQKSQGGSINENYCIYESNRMSFNQIKVAITRAKPCFNYVHLEYTNKIFRKEKPSDKLINIQLKSSTLSTGRIYMIKSKNNEWYYIGKTTDTLENRFNHHVQKPTNKNMKNKLLQSHSIELLEEVVCANESDLDYLEKIHIQNTNYTEFGICQNVLHNTKIDKKIEPYIEIVAYIPYLEKRIKNYEKTNILHYSYTTVIDGVTKHKTKQMKYHKIGYQQAYSNMLIFIEGL
jgi:hypothetical protein